MALFGAATDLSARDRIALPFKCSLENGRLRVETATPERTYPVVGAHEQQPFTYCPPNVSNQCRTFMLHRLSIQCEGGRATWPEVVAAAGRDRGRVSLDNGQLSLRMGPRRDRKLNCGEPEGAGLRSALRWEQCQLASASGAQRALTLPRGYAPLGIIGARLLIDTEMPSAPKTASAAVAATQAPVTERSQAPPATPSTPPAPSPAAPVAAPTAAVSQPQPPKAPPPAPVVVAALPTPAPTPPSLPADPVRSWMPTPVATEPLDAPEPRPTAVEIVEVPVKAVPFKVGWLTSTDAEASILRAGETFADPGRAPSSTLFALMLLATAMIAVVAMATRRRSFQPAMAGDPAPPVGDAPRAVALRSKAEGHIQHIESAIHQLAAVAPLQNALTRDMQSSQRRLAVVIAATADAKSARSVDWTRARRRLERVAQDLDRLQHIADSAVSSLSGLGAARALPRDRNEAYASLGVRPGVSDAIVKKLVDALRVSWHPDLAKSPADREAREVRIKEINVAWDLITGKREQD